MEGRFINEGRFIIETIRANTYIELDKMSESKNRAAHHKIKQSYGLICITRTNPIKILLVKKLNTYNFCDFVSGRYKNGDDKYLRKLFNGMSTREKNEILSMKFPNLWYAIYHVNPENTSNCGVVWLNLYFKKKYKFDKLFLNKYSYLKNLITGTKSVEPNIELPKGKSQNGELPIETAIREVEEETGLGIDNLNILWNIEPYVETYKDCGAVYKNTFYYAEIRNWEPNGIYNIRNNYEVSEIRLLSMQEINNLKLYDSSYEKISIALNKIIRKYKNYLKKYFLSERRGLII